MIIDVICFLVIFLYVMYITIFEDLVDNSIPFLLLMCLSILFIYIVNLVVNNHTYNHIILK